MTVVAGCSKEKEAKPAMTPAAGAEDVQRQWEEGYGTESQTPQTETPTGEPTTGDPTTEPPMTRQQPGSMGQDHAAALAETRCRREIRCDQIGSNRKYPSLEQCQSVLLADSRKELGKCPSGMDRAKVQECATAIETSDCSEPGDTLAEYEECQTVSLCM